MIPLFFAALVVVYLVWRIGVSVRRLDPLPQEASILLCVLLVLFDRSVLGRWLDGLPRTAAIAVLVVELAALCVLWWWTGRAYDRWVEAQRQGDRESRA